MKLVFVLAVAFALAAVVLGPRRLRHAAGVVVALILIYAVLKLTGVIEAIAPDRTGVF